MLIKYSVIPQWLKGSQFFYNLSNDEADGSIDIPDECFLVACDTLKSSKDLTRILTVIRFWGVIQIPHVVLEYCNLNVLSLWHPVFLDIFGQGMCEVCSVYQCFKDPCQFSLSAALSTGRPEFSTFWLDKNLLSSEENKHAIAQACRFGRLDLVETLRKRGFPWDDNCHCAAAQYGHLHILQYLHEHNCPTNRIALKYAARGGHFDCMKYLRSVISKHHFGICGTSTLCKYSHCWTRGLDR